MNKYYCTCNDQTHQTLKRTKVDKDNRCIKCGYYAHYGKFIRVFLERHEKKLDNADYTGVVCEKVK